MSRVREAAKIESVDLRLDRDFFYTVYVGCEIDKSAYQAFGGYVLGKNEEHDREKGKRLQRAWVRELCTVFGVDTKDDLIGRACWVLRDFDLYGEMIRGIEDAESGRRFLARDFVQRHFPEVEVKDPLEQRLESIRSNITRLKQQIVENRNNLVTISSKYVDWSK